MLCCLAAYVDPHLSHHHIFRFFFLTLGRDGCFATMRFDLIYKFFSMVAVDGAELAQVG